MTLPPVHEREHRHLPGHERDVDRVVLQELLGVGLRVGGFDHGDVEVLLPQLLLLLVEQRHQLRGLRPDHGGLHARHVEVGGVTEDDQQQQGHHHEHSERAPVTAQLAELLEDHGAHASTLDPPCARSPRVMN